MWINAINCQCNFCGNNMQYLVVKTPLNDDKYVWFFYENTRKMVDHWSMLLDFFLKTSKGKTIWEDDENIN